MSSTELHLDHHCVEAPAGASIFECAEQIGVRIPTSCRKLGRCKECMVEVVEGIERLSPRGDAERHLRGSYRLACCARSLGEPGIVRAHTLRRGAMKIERQAFSLPGQALRLDPAVRRDGVKVLLDGVEIAQMEGPLHGLAVDIGTTTVVLRLLNLETGEVVADASFENPQRFGGSDVMARIQFDTEDTTKLLQRTLVGYLNHAIEELPVPADAIYEVVIAGNSTMRDLFFRLSVHSIGQSPYQSITEREMAEGKRTSTSLSAPARRLGLLVNPRARVYGLPIISGHVGADAAACMLAVDIASAENVVAVMDIGTNTELVVGNRYKVLAASCPAGPAFEGGAIVHGMPGLEGAIEDVRIGDDGSVATTVIGGGEAEGICGSGLVALLSELLRTGRMNVLGRFEDGDAPLTIASNEEGEVTFSEADVNALAQAKGANVAGLQIAVAEYGIGFEEIDRFYLAGGFGRHLDIDAAKRIGLIPDIDSAKIVQVGNASIEGACIALLSATRRAELEKWVGKVTHCRLETHPGFFDFFVEGCQFAPVRTTPGARS